MVDATAHDTGGAIDPTAARDRSYSYVASRVLTVDVGSERLILRSPASPAVVVAVHDLQPPAMPIGLLAAAQGRTVDLSWEPEFEPDLAGYRVYRAFSTGALPPTAPPPAAPWKRVSGDSLSTPAYRDTVPEVGSYLYRVTAVDRSGNESPASAEIRVQTPASASPN